VAYLETIVDQQLRNFVRRMVGALLVAQQRQIRVLYRPVLLNGQGLIDIIGFPYFGFKVLNMVYYLRLKNFRSEEFVVPHAINRINCLNSFQENFDRVLADEKSKELGFATRLYDLGNHFNDEEYSVQLPILNAKAAQIISEIQKTVEVPDVLPVEDKLCEPNILCMTESRAGVTSRLQEMWVDTEETLANCSAKNLGGADLQRVSERSIKKCRKGAELDSREIRSSVDTLKIPMENLLIKIRRDCKADSDKLANFVKQRCDVFCNDLVGEISDYNDSSVERIDHVLKMHQSTIRAVKNDVDVILSENSMSTGLKVTSAHCEEFGYVSKAAAIQKEYMTQLRSKLSSAVEEEENLNLVGEANAAVMVCRLGTRIFALRR